MGTASTSGASARERRSDAVRNRELLIQAATAAQHREGVSVPLTTIAADAGVGIGTLYRHFPTREQLMDSLTHRSFDQVLANAMAADRDDTAPAECLRHFIEAAIGQRNELVLPLHGGPPPTSPATKATRARVHLVLQHILDRGRADGTIRSDVTPQDIVVFGALLAQPRPADPAWDARCGRLLTTYLRGLGCRADEAIGAGAANEITDAPGSARFVSARSGRHQSAHRVANARGHPGVGGGRRNSPPPPTA